MKHTADIGINVLYEKVDHILSTRDALCVYVWLLCVGGVGVWRCGGEGSDKS